MLVVLLLPSCNWKNHQNGAEYIIILHLKTLSVIFVFRKFILGLKENLQEEDNLSTGEKWPHCVLCAEVLMNSLYLLIVTCSIE